MDKKRRNERVYSNKVKAGNRRTYFFDVQKTQGEDYYITLTESTRNYDGESFTRHKIFLYKEDFNRFLEGLEDAVNHVKEELMPDYDYEEFDRRHKEDEFSPGDDSKDGKKSADKTGDKPDDIDW
ncbi:MAG TPA: DUF3276 family protein [Saprospiraceae bacterium]|nr:DUF3276 family protein [Saprospiraceae bacterium]